ncbi:hypothetical protein G3M48_007503 [Beauveria asiatica]|uniref:Low temperature requirement A protein(LtrA) n=1 Tax=Beauveria asiatica TaxID=1069075 RepID=A0AAW0RM13_9HYPO
MLPNDKIVVVSAKNAIDSARRKYSDRPDVIDFVLQGSLEHRKYLHQARKHHESLRAHLREQHGAAFEKWEQNQQNLNTISVQLSRLSTNTSGLHGNFGKFGFDPRVQVYDDADEAEGDERKGYRQDATIKIAKRPVVRQWFHRDMLWRASEQTEIMAIELFFDLLYVGIIHSNGEHMSEESTGYELLRFSVTFIMSWKIWTDITMTVSWFQTDDALTRMGVLFEIACLLAFTTNMINIFAEDESRNTWTALVSYYLAARFLFAVYYCATAYLVPMICGVMLTSALSVVVPAVLWIASVHVQMPARLGLIWPAIVLDLYGNGIFMAMFRWARGAGEESVWGKRLNRIFDFYPAMNIEHKVERMNAFVSLVLGYSVVGILFQSNGGYTINAILGKATLGLVQAFLFNMIYFDVDGSTVDVHAIRYSANGAILWTFAHLPFIMGYIVASSALSTLVLATDIAGAHRDQLISPYYERSEEDFGLGVRFFYCHGLAIALLAMGAISWSHSHRSPPTTRIPKVYRLANRAAACVILFLLPLAENLKSLQLISTTLGLTVYVVIVEVWGRSCTDESFWDSRRDTSKMRAMAHATRKEREERAHRDSTNPNPGQSGAERMEADVSESTAVR